MKNTKLKGTKWERAIMHVLKNHGFYVIDSRASKGPFDIVAFDRSSIHFIQARNNNRGDFFKSKTERATMESILMNHLVNYGNNKFAELWLKHKKRLRIKRYYPYCDGWAEDEIYSELWKVRLKDDK